MNKSKHLVIVDDDLAIQDALRMALEPQGYKITSLQNGESLLSGALNDADLFILDKQLPGTNGLDVCYFLKSQYNTAATPVIILSASPHIRIQAKKALADDFIEKPFKLKLLRETIERLIISC